MPRFRRALGALVATTLVAGGLAAAPAAAQASPGSASAFREGTPVLSGTGTVGQPLSVLIGGHATLLPVQWLRNGVPIPGASGGAYVPTTEDIGHSISAVVTLPVLGPVTTSAVTIVGDVVPPGDPADPGGPGTPGDPADDLLELIGGLQLPATAEVGQLVALTDPAWSLPGVTTTYQWMRDGVPIPGADDQFYVPTPDDAGHAIWAEVTGTLAGLPGVTVITDVLQIPIPTGSQLHPVSDVTVTGSRKIGTVLTLTGPGWDQDGVTNSYQWLRDDDPIAGARQATYTLVAADFGHAISVKVTGHKEGFTDNTITSDPVSTVVGDAIRFTVKPRVTGTARVGKLLTADPGQWTGGAEGSGPPSYSYQWLRDGAAISGAIAQTYQVSAADAGRALSVLVTATRPAYKAGRFTTAALTVAKLTPRLSATLARKTVKPGQAAVLRIVLRVADLASPTGAVKVLDGTKVLRKAAFTASRKGRLVVKLGKLAPGVHRLRAVYAGSDVATRATSKVVTLTVRKRK